MQKVQKASFFNNPELWNPKEKIWKHFQQIRYQEDLIELKFNCHYVNSQGILKPIYLEIGKKTLYYSKKGILQGQLSLNFTHMTSFSHKGQIRICLSKNSNVLELIINEIDQVQLILTKKCILSTFDENFTLENIDNVNIQYKLHEAIRKLTSEKVTVKAYSKVSLRQLPNGQRCLKNEIKALRMLNSSNIIHLQEVHESENSIFLIMDHLNGEQFSEKIFNQLIPEKNFPILMYNFIRALNQIHQKNIILRNIAPNNLLLKNIDGMYDLVLINFGELQFKGSKTEKFHTITEYMAPEIEEKKIYDEKCDIYSTGVLLYKLIAQNENCKKSQFNFQAEQFTTASRALQSLIKKMLREDPRHRYSAGKCLQHRYFKKVFNPNDVIMDNIESPLNSISQQEMGSPFSARLLDLENLDSGMSMNSESSKSAEVVSLRVIDDEKKQKNKQSKFSTFCSKMKQYQIPQTKIQDESLQNFGFIKKNISFNI